MNELKYPTTGVGVLEEQIMPPPQWNTFRHFKTYRLIIFNDIGKYSDMFTEKSKLLENQI